MKENPKFLIDKYKTPQPLHKSTEVTQTLNRRNALIDRGVEGYGDKPKISPDNAEAAVQNYLDRFKEILDRKEPEKRERGIEAIKRILHRDNIIDAGTATDQYIKRQKRMAREQGHGDIQVPASLQRDIQNAAKNILAGKSAEHVLRNFPNEQKQLVEEITALVEWQKESLDKWVDYLVLPDADYPDWLKYWAMRNVLSLSKYDKDKKIFPKRTNLTTNPFPDLNQEALSKVLDWINKKCDEKDIDLNNFTAQDKKELEKILEGENFGKLYGWAMEKFTPAPTELLKITDGKWIKYKQGSNYVPLTQSLQDRSTGWCTAGEMVAESQLSRGDFYVYYSLDEQNKPTIPRAAIRMEGDHIAEVRGRAPNQNLDPYIADTVRKKMHDFPDGKAYEKKAGDMKRLTTIEHQTILGIKLTKDDLIFLYEIDSPIEGFGYQRDPRIQEILKKRNPKEDAPIVLDCQPNEIAWVKADVKENTKAYIGPLFSGIFKKLGHLEHIYTSFPEGKIRRQDVEIGGMNADQLKTAIETAGMKISEYAKDMLTKIKSQKKSEQIHAVRLKVRDLFGDVSTHTTDDIYRKAEDFGLELCPAEVGPHLRLNYKDQPLGEWFSIAMKQIADPGGYPSVFYLHRNEGGVWLRSSWAEPLGGWFPVYEFMFRLRK